MSTRSEAFVSVDIEASGPSPSTGSLLSIGACLVDDPDVGFYVEIKPNIDFEWDVQAERIHGLALEHLLREGLEPADAMRGFAAWVNQACADRQAIFVGFNAPFDWMFVADYFWRYTGGNPFGISALDLKSYFMARQGHTTWEQTRRRHIDAELGIDPDHNHHALDDARGQARLAQILFRPR